LPLIDEVDSVSSVGHNQEEVVPLGGRKAVGDDVESNSDEDSAISSADVFDGEGDSLELGIGNNTVESVEAESSGTGAARGGRDTGGALRGARLALSVGVLEPSVAAGVAVGNAEVLTEGHSSGAGSAE